MSGVVFQLMNTGAYGSEKTQIVPTQFVTAAEFTNVIR